MIPIIELKIDPEFRDKIPPLTDAEFEQLKDNILADGEVYEPICVWDGTIVDGHNRWKIVQEHPEIPFRTKEMHFADKWEAFDWMYKKQLGRRNLTDEQRTYLLGKMYEARKHSRGNTTSTRAEDGTFQCTQNGNNGEIRGRIGDIIAKEQGVGNGTVLRSYQFSKGIDALSEVSKEAADKVLNGGSCVNKSDVMDLVKKNEDEVKEFAESVVSGEAKQQKKKRSGNPASLVPGGFTKEEREQRERIEQIVNNMYDTESEKTFTVENFIEEITLNGDAYVSQLGNSLSDHNDLITVETLEEIDKAVEKIIKKIEKVRDKYL